MDAAKILAGISTPHDLLRDARRELAERDLGHFIEQAWPILEPANPFSHNWHIDLIAEYLRAIEAGQIRRLIINIPPRHTKSIVATVAYPAWVWTTNPARRFIRVSYSASLSEKHNVMSRDLIQSAWYQKNWGDRFSLKRDTNRRDDYRNNHHGMMFSTSVGGTLTGEGADVIIIDDPQNPKQANSDAERMHAIDFFSSTLQTRLNDPKKGAFVIIMQRLHEKDLTGHVLASDLGYEHVCLPAQAEQRTIINFPVSGKQLIREPGDILDGRRFTPAILEGLKRSMGSYQYAGQYQQIPAPVDGEIFKREWFAGRFNPAAVPRSGQTISSWDLPFKKSEGSAECAGVVMKRHGATIYILDLVHDKMSFTDSVRAIKDMTAKHPKATAKVIEDKANGPAVMDYLKPEMPGLVSFNPKGSKLERALSVTPFWEAGDILLPEGAPWAEDFIEQHLRFPRAELKDIVDATTQGVQYLMQRSSANVPPPQSGLEKESYWRS